MRLIIEIDAVGKINGESWDVTKSDSRHHEMSIALDEETWMNPGISPDDQKIAFDLLGGGQGSGASTPFRKDVPLQSSPTLALMGK